MRDIIVSLRSILVGQPTLSGSRFRHECRLTKVRGGHRIFKFLVGLRFEWAPFLLVACFCIVASDGRPIHADDASTTTSAVEVAIEEQAEKVSDQNLTRSMTFVTEQDLERTFSALQRLIKKQNWSTIGEYLLELQREDPEILVEFQGVTASVSVVAGRMIASLPPAGLAAYRRLAEPVAQEELRVALANSDAQALLNVVRYFRHTQAAEKALELMVRILIDQGEGDRAAMVELSKPSRQLQHAVSGLRSRRQALISQTQPDSVPPDFLTNVLPSRIPVWEQLQTLDDQVRRSVATTYHELRQSGLGPYPSLSLTSGPQGLVMGGAASRQGIDPATGKILWRRDIPGYGPKWLRTPGNLGDANRRRLFAMTAAWRVFDDTVTSRTTVVGDRLYLVETIASDDPLAQYDDESIAIFPATRLICAEAQTGKTLWNYEGSPAGTVFMAGPPLVLGERIYAWGESKETNAITLFILNATNGKPIKRLKLASSLYPLANDQRRQGQACRMQIDGGHLICATSAGAVVAVDLLTSELLWALRLPRSDAVARYLEANDLQIHQTGFQFWDSWQETQFFSIGNQLVFAIPESDFLYAIDRQTGERLWTIPRGQAARIASADADSGIVLIEKRRARALDLKTGQQQWEVMIPQPAGRGVLVEESYVFPVLERETARLNLKTGSFRLSLHSSVQLPEPDGVLASRIRPRNLVADHGNLYEIGLDGVRKLQSPQQALAAASFRSGWEETLNTIEREEWIPAAGQLETLLNTSAKDESLSIKKTLLSVLTSTYRKVTSRTERARLTLEIDQLAATPFEKAAWRQLRARDMLRRRNWSGFVSLWLESSEEELKSLLSSLEEDSRCRLDRWFQSKLTRLMKELPADEAARLTQLIEERLPPIVALEPELRHLWLTRLGQTTWGQRYRVQGEIVAVDQRERIDSQLQLLQISRSDSNELAAAATYRLFQMYQQQSQWIDAQRWLLRLSEFPPETILPENGNVGNVLQEYQASIDQAVNADSSNRAWKKLNPRVKVRTSHSNEVYLLPLPVQTVAGGMISRMAIEMDYPVHGAVRFNGSRWKRPWYHELPRTSRNLRHDAWTNRVWGFEQFCLLQTGSEVFGFSPVDESGARSSVLLWPPRDQPIDTLGSRDNLMLTFQREALSQRPGYELPDYHRLDEFSHEATALGPIRPGYFCIQQLGMLVAYETSTGKEIWRRYDLPKLAQCYGDDQRVAVVASESKTVSFYSCWDGSFLSQSTWPYRSDEVVRDDGLNLLLVRGDRRRDEFDSLRRSEEKSGGSSSKESNSETPVVLEKVNAFNGETIWKREWKQGSLPFEIDDRWAGMLKEQGAVELIDLRTGETLVRHQLAVPEKIERIVCSVAEHDFIVIFSARPPTLGSDLDSNTAALLQVGYRRPVVAGLGYGFDRTTGQLLWTQKIEDVVFPMDQPVDLPVFVTIGLPPAPVDAEETPPDPVEPESEKPTNPEPETAEPDEAENFETKVLDSSSGLTLRCSDRRTGRMLQELSGERNLYYSLTGNRKKQQVKLNTVKSRIEIDFSAKVIEPALNPAIEGTAPGAPGK